MVWASGNYIELNVKRKDAENASHQGQCDDDVKWLSEQSYIKKQTAKIDAESLRKELKEYGAWDEEELADHEQNIQRILWIFSGNIKDGNN